MGRDATVTICYGIGLDKDDLPYDTYKFDTLNEWWENYNGAELSYDGGDWDKYREKVKQFYIDFPLPIEQINGSDYNDDKCVLYVPNTNSSYNWSYIEELKLKEIIPQKVEEFKKFCIEHLQMINPEPKMIVFCDYS